MVASNTPSPAASPASPAPAPASTDGKHVAGQNNRMFESNFFEFFSHIHPWQPPVIYVPLISYWSYRSFSVDVGLLMFLGLFATGFFAWTFAEYALHRKLFHYQASSKLGKRMFWLLHGVHHDWPTDKLRLVFPPTISLPLAALFFGIFTVIAGPALRYSLMAGFAAGYLTYDMIHYWVHHFTPRGRVGKALRRHHLEHHFKHSKTGYGVSSPLWDYVFGTRHPVRAKPAA
jgi:sterol desaturase/sphingolipid hydroxylase (fatty acid hydroxylase superfamily)